MYIFDCTGNYRRTNLGNLIPQAPSIHVGIDGNIRMLLPPGSNSNDGSKTNTNENQSSICAMEYAQRVNRFHYPMATTGLRLLVTAIIIKAKVIALVSH